MYSIFVGDPDKNSYGMNIMEKIASKKENEKHFFVISNERIEDILQKMINKGNGGRYYPLLYE